MADLQSMTLAERMTTINNAEHSLSDGINDFTFQEACNKWLIETGTVNSVSYSGISINKYTPEEAFAIIRHKVDLRSETLNELVSELGSYYPISKYTATEALNKKNAVLVPYSLSFNGSSNYVSLGAQTAPNVDQITISAWVRIASSGGNVVTWGETMLEATTSAVNMYTNVSGGGGITRLEVSTVLVTASNWHHVVVTRGSDDTGKCYVDSVLIETDSSLGAINTASQNSYIGMRGDSSTHFDGRIDEVSIFSKELTQAEVTNLYSADPQNAGDAVGITNLVGYWKFDEGSGEPQDTSGNGNHGTITGATWTVH